MTDKPPGWNAAEADAIVRFLDGLAEDFWHLHGDAITAYREARRERIRPSAINLLHRLHDRDTLHDQKTGCEHATKSPDFRGSE
jgi:hypothetical protein